MSPLPESPPFRSIAPVRAGIGLQFNYHNRFAFPDWPADWWQRNYDLPIIDPDGPPPMIYTDRMLQLPPPPKP